VLVGHAVPFLSFHVDSSILSIESLSGARAQAAKNPLCHHGSRPEPASPTRCGMDIRAAISRPRGYARTDVSIWPPHHFSSRGGFRYGDWRFDRPRVASSHQRGKRPAVSACIQADQAAAPSRFSGSVNRRRFGFALAASDWLFCARRSWLLPDMWPIYAAPCGSTPNHKVWSGAMLPMRAPNTWKTTLRMVRSVDR